MSRDGLEVNPALVLEGTHTIEGGIVAYGKLLNAPNPPTAVVCSNDVTAMGVMRKAYEEGIQIPADLSVIGFDDIRLSQFILPALTKVQMSQAELARLAFNALLEELQRARRPNRNRVRAEDTSRVARVDTTGLESPKREAAKKKFR